MMILAGLHKFKNALSDSIVLQAKEFEIGGSVMRVPSREGTRIQVCIVARIDKDC